MSAITDARIAILATNGFEQSELEVPLKTLRAKGAKVEIISLEPGEITGWEKKDWGSAVPVDLVLDQITPNNYDALVLPGGQMNPDILRVDENVVDFVRAFYATGKTLAAICHAPWLLIEAGIIKGKRATSYKSIVTDMKNAGAKWEDSETVVDGNLITARNPGDLEAFCAAIVESIEAGRSQRVAAE